MRGEKYSCAEVDTSRSSETRKSRAHLIRDVSSPGYHIPTRGSARGSLLAQNGQARNNADVSPSPESAHAGWRLGRKSGLILSALLLQSSEIYRIFASKGGRLSGVLLLLIFRILWRLGSRR